MHRKIDINLPGALELVLKRTYASNLPGTGCFGPKWRSTWGQWIELDEDVATFYAADGRLIRFPLNAAQAEGEWLRNLLVNKIRFRRERIGFAVRDANLRILRFEEQVARRWLLTRIEDPNGNAIQFKHDVNGALREVTHTGGYRLRVECAAQQIRRVNLIDDDNQSTELVRYEYDAAGCLAAVFDSSGKPFRYQYDSGARITRWQDRERTWYAYRYDGKGRCVEAFGPEGIYHYRLSYDEGKRTTRSVDSLGGVTILKHNTRLQLVERTDARGGVTQTVWDSRSNKLKEIDPEGRTVEFTYDDDGNVLTTSDPLGQTIQFTYNKLGLPVVLTDAASKVWTRSYDERGNLVESGLQGAESWRYERNGRGNVTRVVDPERRTREFGYDERGLLIWATDWKQHHTHYHRDAQGRVIEEIDRLGNATRFAYGTLGRLTQLIHPTRSQLRWEYDAEGNVIRRVSADGQTWTYVYGVFDLLKQVRKPSGSQLRFEHNSEALLTAVENERAEVYSYEYNATGQVVAEQDFAGRRLHFDYDASGLCVQTTNGQGEKTLIYRDACGQLIREQSADSEAVFAYDACGRMVSAKNNVIDVSFARDAYGRVVHETQGARTVQSSYDVRGLRTKRGTSSGNEIEWRYDDNGLVAHLGLPGDQFLEFVRDDAGREVERRMRGDLVLRQEFDPLDRLTKQWAGVKAAEEKPIVDRSYGYDGSGNPVKILDSRWGRSEFEYDADGRILAARRERGASEEFTYDPAGEITSSRILLSGTAAIAVPRSRISSGLKDRRYRRGGRLEQADETEFVYDGDGRVVEKRKGEARWQFNWTIGGQLRSVRLPDGDLSTYEYDALGRRVKKTVPRGTAVYLWDGEVVAEEIRDSSTATWAFGAGTFVPMAKYEAGTAYSCVTDQVGTPQELIDSDGRLAWSAQLTTWGELEATGNEETDCPIRFPGQWWDEECGLCYNWFRYYDAAVGRYLTPDPIGLLGGAQSYGYVRNPLSWIDPLGLAGCENETFYRTMSEKHFKRLVKTGEVPATGETFTSPTQSFSESYDGALVKFTMSRAR